jgi:hypothetical protein
MAFLPFLDPLLGRPAAVVELRHPPVGPGQVGHDEADPRPEFALMPLDFGHHATSSGPALGLVVEAREPNNRLLRRAADGSGQEMADVALQHLVRRQADRVPNAFGLQHIVDLGLRERRVGTEVEVDAPLAVAGDHRLQDQAPVLCAVGVAGPQEATLQVAELVEQEQRMVTGAAEMTVPDRAFLLAMGRALGTVHVEDDRAGRLASVHPVDPDARQIRQGRQVGVPRQPLGLEAPHLAARRGRTIETLTADDGSHRGIAGEPRGVVDILVAGEAAEYRLPKQPAQLVTGVLATAAIEELGNRDIGEFEGIVEFAVSKQAAVRCDPGAVEFQLDPTVEIDPERLRFRFTHRVRHDRPAQLVSTC